MPPDSLAFGVRASITRPAAARRLAGAPSSLAVAAAVLAPQYATSIASLALISGRSSPMGLTCCFGYAGQFRRSATRFLPSAPRPSPSPSARQYPRRSTAGRRSPSSPRHGRPWANGAPAHRPLSPPCAPAGPAPPSAKRSRSARIVWGIAFPKWRLRLTGGGRTAMPQRHRSRLPGIAGPQPRRPLLYIVRRPRLPRWSVRAAARLSTRSAPFPPARSNARPPENEAPAWRRSATNVCFYPSGPPRLGRHDHSGIAAGLYAFLRRLLSRSCSAVRDLSGEKSSDG